MKILVYGEREKGKNNKIIKKCTNDKFKSILHNLSKRKLQQLFYASISEPFVI